MNKKRNAKRNYRPLYFFLGVVLLIFIWDIIYLSTEQNTFPEFFVTLGEMFKLMGKAKVWQALGFSFYRLILTTVIVTIAGTLLGLLAAYFPPVEQILKPLIYILTCFPTASLILFFIIYTDLTCYLLIGVVTLPIIYKAVLGGGKIILNRYKDPIATEGRYSNKNLISVVLPLSLPYVFIGLAQSLGLGLKIEIMGEIFISNNHFIGIGKMINDAYQVLDMVQLFGLTMFAIVAMIVVDLGVYFIKRWLFKKYGTEPVKVFSLKATNF